MPVVGRRNQGLWGANPICLASALLCRILRSFMLTIAGLATLTNTIAISLPRCTTFQKLLNCGDPCISSALILRMDGLHVQVQQMTLDMALTCWDQESSNSRPRFASVYCTERTHGERGSLA